MGRNLNDSDLNLQSFNDHGIFTIDELNELFFHCQAILFSVTSKYQKFKPTFFLIYVTY